MGLGLKENIQKKVWRDKRVESKGGRVTEKVQHNYNPGREREKESEVVLKDKSFPKPIHQTEDNIKSQV
jgi:hypothetical protein